MSELSVNVEGEGLVGPPPRGRGWRRISTAVVALAVAFVVGAGVGFQLHGGRPATPAPQRSEAAGRANVSATGRDCAVQDGTLLWLGIEVINRGPGPVTLQSMDFATPLGGLAEQTGLWGVCGQLDGGAGPGPHDLAEGATTWISGAFQVRVECPGPLPVQFLLSYSDSTGASIQGEHVGGFPDLGGVRYSGCDTATAQP